MYLKILLIGLFIFTSIYAKTNDDTKDERKNKIQSTELINDNEYLKILIEGNFIPKSNFELFINIDENEDTGYLKDGKVKGAEYLVENHTLFVYAGNGSSWKWTKVVEIESHTSEILWNAKIPLSSLDVNRGERIEYIAKVMTQDWQKGSYGKGGIFTIPKNEKESLFTLTQSGEFSQFMHFSFFIDADNNSNTGYTRGKIKGADFLVEDNGVLYQYPKDATGWKWDKVQDGIVFTHTDTIMQMEISSILLGNTKFITYYAMSSTSDWKRNDVFDAQSLNNTINIDNQMITYSELDGNIKNPERGLYTNHYLPSSEYKMGKYTAHSVPGNLGWILQGDYRVFVEKLILIDFKDKAISKNYLDIVRSEFEAVRKNGLKMILRVTYNESMQETDAPLHIVLNHIEQLNPIFNEFKDVIMTVQAGFIGAWGEWHSSTHGLDKDNHAKDAIKNALLKAVPSSITVQFRKPSEIIRWYPSPLTSKDAYTSNDQSRIGFHDDCFNWSASDMGTFRGDATNIKLQKEYISKISRFTPFMGETCNEDITHAVASTTSCENALEMAEKMHLTSLGNVFVNNDNITTPVEIYHNEGCWDEIVRRLGYRFVLKNVTLPTVATIDNSFSGEIKIENNGFASLVNRREAYLVLENENKRFEFKLNTDPRKWEPNQTTTIKFHTTLANSLTEGKYKVALWLPDMHENLKDNPKYAIRTANTNSWDSQKGYNVLGEVEVISKDILTVKKNRINSTNISNNNESLLINVKGSFVPESNFTLFINADNNKSTGYKKTEGIDYLVQNNTLFSYSGNGNNWKWTKIGKIKSQMTARSWKAIVPLSVLDIKSKKKITTVVKIFTKDWKADAISKIKLYTLSEVNQDVIPIVIIGPSTVYIGHEVNGDKYYSNDGVCRLEGWGERLYDYASSPNDIYNYARPGSNATSFMESPVGKSLEVQTLYGPNRDHYWAKTKDKMRQLGGGILLIQYGANEPDADENDFKTSIRTYIDEAKELNFIPILITEIEKRIRNQDGTLWRARGDYPKWMKELAEENNLRLLDLNKKSYEEYRKLNNKQWHNQFADCYNEWAVNTLVSEKGYTRENAKIAAWENTHFEVKGAKIVASWIRDLACEEKNSKICKLLNRKPKSFSLSSNRFIPANGSPALSWSNIPKGTKSFAVIIDDYDAKDGSLNWVHWSIFNISRNTHSVAAKNTPRGALVELNSNASRSYADPVFPNEHKYVAHIYALDIADITKTVRFKDYPIYKENQKYDHVKFEKIYGNFILDKSEIRSK